jgi:hypothetical protein
MWGIVVILLSGSPVTTAPQPENWFSNCSHQSHHRTALLPMIHLGSLHASTQEIVMGKRKQTGRGSPVDSAVQAKAEAMIAKIRAHYRRGEEANAAQREGTQFPKEFAAEKGVTLSTLRWEKRFATRYTEPQVKALCRLRRPNGLSLHFGHVMYLLGVEDRAQRRDLERQAAEHGWTAPELNSEIPDEFRHKTEPGHGRPLKKPRSPAAGLRQLRSEADVLVRRCKLITREMTSAAESGLDRALKQEGRATADQLEETAKSARDAARRLRAMLTKKGKRRES